MSNYDTIDLASGVFRHLTQGGPNSSLNYIYDPAITGFRAWRTTDNAGSSGVAIQGGSTVSNSTVSGANGTPLAANSSRKSLFIQNLSTGAGGLYVRLSSSPASATNFNALLSPASGPTIGDGGTFSDDFGIWKGAVSVSGNSPSYTAWEIS